MVLSCIDPRFQSLVNDYLKKKKLDEKYSAFTIAGAAIGVTNNKFKEWHNTFYENLATSIKLHKIKKLIVINHKDCGAAKIVKGKKFLNLQDEKKIHLESFLKLRSQKNQGGAYRPFFLKLRVKKTKGYIIQILQYYGAV